MGEGGWACTRTEEAAPPSCSAGARAVGAGRQNHFTHRNLREPLRRRNGGGGAVRSGGTHSPPHVCALGPTRPPATHGRGQGRAARAHEAPVPLTRASEAREQVCSLACAELVCRFGGGGVFRKDRSVPSCGPCPLLCVLCDRRVGGGCVCLWGGGECSSVGQHMNTAHSRLRCGPIRPVVRRCRHAAMPCSPRHPTCELSRRARGWGESPKARADLQRSAL